MQPTMRFAPIVLSLVFALSGLGCASATPQGRVAAGELYATGKPNYDAYFKEVHALQKQATEWEQERQAARKGIWSQLSLLDDTPDVSLVEAVSAMVGQVGGGPYKLEGKANDLKITGPEGKAEGPFFKALEGLVRSEKERAERLRRHVPTVGNLERTGADLRGQSQRDFNNGAFGENRQSVALELDTSIKVVHEIGQLAVRRASEADDLTNLIKRALAARECAAPAPPPPADPKDTTPGKGGKGGKDAPKDPPKGDKGKGGGEMFNP
jgi:hypothetical protein